MTFIRILLCCLILITALSSTIILYHFIYLLTRSSVRPPAAHTPKLGSKSLSHHTIENSDIRTRFDTLENITCHESRSLSSIEYNNELWQVVPNRTIYLYNSFYDVRYRYRGENFHFVRIIATSKGQLNEGLEGRDKRNLFCTFWFYGEETPKIVVAELKEIWVREFNPHPPSGTYHSYLISCPLPHKYRLRNTIPSHVSVSTSECEGLSNFLPVRKEGLMEVRLGQPKKQYVVCVKGMNFLDDISYRIIEWVEFIFILGATKIDFYVYYVHENVLNVLNYYESLGKVQVIATTLPGEQPNAIDDRTRYLKQNLWQKRRNELVIYNDCLYRNMYLYNFIIPLDVDEVPVPVKDRTWSEMFRRMFRERPTLLRKYASFSVPNAYFFSKWNQTVHTTSAPSELDFNSETTSKLFMNLNNYKKKFESKLRFEASVARRKFHMLNHVKRSANFSKPGHNVKSFVSTKNTLLTFNHYALQALLPSLKNNLLLNSSLIQLNHYQEKCSRYILSQCINSFDRHSVVDNIIEKYSEELKARVEETHRDM
ncbi:Glycosyltransferase family 92, partial [Trinorchestia longiramus]